MEVRNVIPYLVLFEVIAVGLWVPVFGDMYTSLGATQEMVALYTRRESSAFPLQKTYVVEDCALLCAGEDHCHLYMRPAGKNRGCVYFKVPSTLPQPQTLNTETRRERRTVLVGINDRAKRETFCVNIKRDVIADNKCESTSDPSTGKVSAEVAMFLPFGRYFIFSQYLLFKMRTSHIPTTYFCLTEVCPMNKLFLIRVYHPVRAMFVHKLANDTNYRVHVVDERGNHLEYFGGHESLRPQMPSKPLTHTRHNLWLMEGNMSAPQDAVDMLRESMAFEIIPCGLLNISDHNQVNVSDVIYTCALRVAYNMTLTYRVKIEAYALTFWEVISPLHGQPSDVTALMLMENQSGYVAFVGSEMFMYTGSTTGVPVQSTLYGHFIK